MSKAAHSPLPLSAARVTRAGADGDSQPHPLLVKLVASAQRGDREAFGQIFDRFQLAVYRYALARLRSPEDAEDAAAETFLAAFRAIDRFAWQGVPFEAWLFRIARSKIADHQRRDRRQPPMSDIDAVDPVLLPHATDVASEVAGRHERAGVLEAMRFLSADQQEVLSLRLFAGLSLHETAVAMGRSTNAVKQLQFRAMCALRDRMARR